MKKASAVTGYWKVKPDNNKKIGTTVSVKVVNTKGKTVTETKKHVHISFTSDFYFNLIRRSGVTRNRFTVWRIFIDL